VEHERTDDRKRIAAALFALAAKNWEKGPGRFYFSSQITDRRLEIAVSLVASAKFVKSSNNHLTDALPRLVYAT
jgi:hypothetical protein